MDQPAEAQLPPVPIDPGVWRPSQLLQCKICQAPVAFLTFVPEVGDAARIEDYARQIYPALVRWNVPSWIVGPPLEETDSEQGDVADIAPVWRCAGRGRE